MAHLKKIVAASALSLTLAGSALALAGWTSERTTAAHVAATGTHAEGKTYQVDGTHSSVNFRILHSTIAPFYGRFNDFRGTIVLDADDMTNSSMEFTVKIASIDTNNSTRDGHLKDADFFNARQFPNAAFKSTGVEQGPNGTYLVTGDLALRGVTKSVTATIGHLKAADIRGEDRLGLEAKFTIKRGDFEINKYLASDGGDDGPLGNTVDLTVAIEAVAQ